MRFSAFRDAVTTVGFSPVCKVCRGDIVRYFSDSNLVLEVIASAVTLPQVKMDQPFHCVLPDHDQSSPSATLGRNRKGVIVYHDTHPGRDHKVHTLPEVYFAQKTGSVQKLRGPTGAVWALDLLRSAGILRPIDDVGLPELPATASATVSKVHTGFRRLLTVKWTYETGAQPVTFSHRFAAEWCGVSEREASQAIKELLHLKIIHIAAHIPGPFGKPMALFAPGPGSESQSGGRNG